MQFTVSKTRSAPAMRHCPSIEKFQFRKLWSPQLGRPSPLINASGRCTQIDLLSQNILQHLSKNYSDLKINPSISVIQFLKGGQPIHFAVQNYDMVLFDLLLATGQFDVNLLDKNKRSALLVACELSNTTAVKKLISARSNLVEKDVDGVYPLECICKDQILKPIEILDLLTKLPSEDIFKAGSLLHYTKDLATIQFFVEHGVSIDTVNSEGKTILWRIIENFERTFLQIEKKRILSVIENLIKLGASCDKILPLLAKIRDEALLISLKKFGFAPNAQDQNGDNLILLTCRSHDRKSRVGISCWLLDLIRLGCDPTQLNKCNECALTLIAEFQFIPDSFILDLLSNLSANQLHQAASVIFFTKSKEILEVFFKSGNVPIDYYNELGDTALYLAVKRLDIELIKFLLSKGADPDFATVKRGYLEGLPMPHQTPYKLLLEKKRMLVETMNCYNSKIESDIKEPVVEEVKTGKFIEVKLNNLKIKFDECDDEIIMFDNERAEKSENLPLNKWKNQVDKDEDEIIILGDCKTEKSIFSKGLVRTPNIMITPEVVNPKISPRSSKTLFLNKYLSKSPPKVNSNKLIGVNHFKINERRPHIVPMPLSSQKDLHLFKLDIFNEIQALFDDFRNGDLAKTPPVIDSQASSYNDHDEAYDSQQSGSTVSLSSEDSSDDTEDEKILE